MNEAPRNFQEILAGKTIFFKLDLKEVLHQIPMNEEAIKKTAVSAPFGLFEYVFMPCGLCNALQTQ